MFSIKKICNLLNISVATFNNWQKVGLVPKIPQDCDDDTFQKYVDLISKIVVGKLSSRANRCTSQIKHIVYQGIVDKKRKLLLRKLIYKFDEAKVSVEIAVLSLIINILKTNQLISDEFFLTQKSRIEQDLKIWCENVCIKQDTSFREIEEIFSDFSIQYEKDDILGAFYQSIQRVCDNAKKGSFYTPTTLIHSIKCSQNQTVYDPCCGSGNILINVISPQHDDSKIFASDIDEIALKICETNLVLFFKNPNIKSHIFKQDIIFGIDNNVKYDLIVTNPPWGAKFDIEQKARLLKLYPNLKSTESFVIALYVCLNCLSEKGKVAIFLPESILNVKTHIYIRKFLLSQPYKFTIDILGHAFQNVVSNALLLSFDKSEKQDDILISSNKEVYTLKKTDCFGQYYFITAKANNRDFKIIKKIYEFSHCTLENNAIFALGIVTGNNKTHIKYEFSQNLEPIYRGKNITPCGLSPSKEYVEFVPSKFQQVAPIDFYRKRKIVYKFISDKIVCCISENGELMLNSANMFIPTIDYPFETIVMLFNSYIYEFLYKKQFNSIKVLRSQIEALPLPHFSEEQHLQIKNSYLSFINNEISEFDINKLIANMLNIDDEDFSYIQSCL